MGGASIPLKRHCFLTTCLLLGSLCPVHGRLQWAHIVLSSHKKVIRQRAELLSRQGRPGDLCITFTFMHLADTFIQSDLQCIQVINFCVCSLGIEPTTFALLTQCSTTEPQQHCMTPWTCCLSVLAHGVPVCLALRIDRPDTMLAFLGSWCVGPTALRTRDRRSVYPCTALPNPCWKCLPWQPSFCAPCLGSRLALARRGPSKKTGGHEGQSRSLKRKLSVSAERQDWNSRNESSRLVGFP